MKGSELVFDYVNLLHWICHKTNPTHIGTYIDWPDWIKNKKATIDPINKNDNKCLQYAVTVTLNNKEIKKDQKIINIIILSIEKGFYYYSALLKGIASNDKGDFYCLNCIHSFITKNKLKWHKKDVILFFVM